ncbi:Bifunctional oligoribonuclease/PAP phosphatase NrnA [[Mycoplasma] cavipharyngis]|uniref:DHH family phosphoesterase n=1 Tax=[Mycoplasma] cavipharyngis TaxID=92757 RepID=UPI0037049E98
MNHSLIIHSQKIWQLISEAKIIVIFHHIRPDGDCLGAQFGLKKVIETNFPDKIVYCLGDSKNLFPFLDFQMDSIDDIPIEAINDHSLAIVVDASNANRIEFGDFLVNANFTKRIRIDHHPNDHDVNYDYAFIDSSYVACCQQILALVQASNLVVNRSIANYLYLGINTDSGGFNYNQLDQKFYELIAWLFEQTEFDFFYINKNLKMKTVSELKYAAEVLTHFKKENRVCSYIVTEQVLNKFNLTDAVASAVNLIANVDDSLIWLFLIEIDNNQYRCRLRSNQIKVNQIAIQFNGGGHDWAAGATINRSDQAKLFQVINEAINHYVQIS